MKEFITIPCRCTFKNGAVSDFCIVMIQKKPVISDDMREGVHYFYISDVARIEPSEYAMPQSVRIGTTEANEIRNSFAPTTVQSIDGQKFTLNWTNHFFRHNDLKGKDMMLAPMQEDFDMHIVEVDYRQLFIIVDWKPEYDVLKVVAA
jgi:hypothetical protein